MNGKWSGCPLWAYVWILDGLALALARSGLAVAFRTNSKEESNGFRVWEEQTKAVRLRASESIFEGNATLSPFPTP